MSYDEDEEVQGSFRLNDDNEDEPLEPLDMPDMDFGLDEEDPDKDR